MEETINTTTIVIIAFSALTGVCSLLASSVAILLLNKMNQETKSRKDTDKDLYDKYNDHSKEISDVRADVSKIKGALDI